MVLFYLINSFKLSIWVLKLSNQKLASVSFLKSMVKLLFPSITMDESCNSINNPNSLICKTVIITPPIISTKMDMPIFPTLH